MLVIDGSYGEGGGQILRVALALSCILGVDIKVERIRAKRDNPGLRPQHLTAVKAVSELCHAEVEGLNVGSQSLVFKPGSIRGGLFKFNIGTAGSITLVLQTLLPVMAFSHSPVEVELIGGTDVPWSPPIDYVRYVLLPHLSKLGYEVNLTLVRRGHYPKGGGLVKVRTVNQPRGFNAIVLDRRGDVSLIKVFSHCVKLPKDVAVRQANAAEKTLKDAGIKAPLEVNLEFYEPNKDPHLGPGSGVVLVAHAGDAILGSDALGAKGKRAEVVGSEAAEKLIKDLNTNAALDTHMSDNILIYLSLSKGKSVITGAELSTHAQTALWVIKQFIDVEYVISGELGNPFKLEILPRTST